MLVSVCGKYGFSPRVLHEIRSVASQIAYVSCRQGVTLAPESMTKLAPNNVSVKRLTEEIMAVRQLWPGIVGNTIQ